MMECQMLDVGDREFGNLHLLEGSNIQHLTF